MCSEKANTNVIAATKLVFEPVAFLDLVYISDVMYHDMRYCINHYECKAKW